MNKGQILVTLLFFVLITVIITTGAIVVIFTNSLSASKLEQGNISYYIAESGIENALIRLLRNPSYQGETLPIDGATASITVSGSNLKTITSVGTNGNFSRTIQVVAEYSDNILTVTSWKEVY